MRWIKTKTRAFNCDRIDCVYVDGNSINIFIGGVVYSVIECENAQVAKEMLDLIIEMSMRESVLRIESVICIYEEKRK